MFAHNNKTYAWCKSNDTNAYLLSQIEALEARACCSLGPALDSQQVSKVSQKAALLEALHVSH